MPKKILYLFAIYLLFFLKIALFAGENKVIYLISTPRSLSTAFLKMMHYRGDFLTIHEPSTPLYYNTFYPSYWSKNTYSYRNPQDLLNILSRHSSSAHIFVKDTVLEFSFFYSLCPKDFFKDKNIHFVFLVRDPKDVVYSLYRATENDESFMRHYKDAQGFYNSVGIEKMWRLILELSNDSKIPPKVIFSEDLYENPEKTVAYFCSYYQIPFSKSHLTWPGGDDKFLNMPRKDEKGDFSFVDAYFSNAIGSTHFHEPNRLSKKPETALFDDIDNIRIKAILREVYQKSMIYYEKIKKNKELHLSET